MTNELDDPVPRVWHPPPAGQTSVWKRVELIEKNDEGLGPRQIRVAIQTIPDEPARREEAIKLMVDNFVPSEPICSSLNIKDNEHALRDFRHIWNYCLDQGICVGAYKLGPDDQLLEVIGVNMLMVECEGTTQDMEDMVRRFKSELSQRVFAIIHKVHEEAEEELRKLIGPGNYISALGLCVIPKYRGQQLGVDILRARDSIGQRYGLRASSTLFTAASSQIQAARAGFVTVHEIKYQNLFDDKGELAFPGIRGKDLKIMAKKIPLLYF